MRLSPRWLAAISSATYAASIRLSTASISTSNVSTNSNDRGPNLLKQPVEPSKRVIKSLTNSSIESENVYKNNNESPIKYSIKPPIAKMEPLYTKLPWDTVIDIFCRLTMNEKLSLLISQTVDNYAWLRDEKSAETISYLESENVFTDFKMKHTEKTQQLLYKEMLRRIVEDDSSVPAKSNNFLYYSRTEKGAAYTIYCRKEVGKEDKEQILLNVNDLAKNEKFLSIGTYSVSPNDSLLAYSTDTVGDEKYNLQFKDLQSGELLADYIENIADMCWANDNSTIYYIKYDDAWRPYQLYRHKLGQNVENDTLIYQEDDEKFRISVDRTRDNKFILLHIGSSVTDEVHYIDANKCNENEFECIMPRQQGIEYSVDHQNNDFLILMNDENAINFQLYAIKDDNAKNNKKEWKKVIDHNDEITLRSIECFADFIIINQRRNGLPEFRIRYGSADNEFNEHIIALPDKSYDIWTGANLEYETDKFRFEYTSLITPKTTYEYDVNDKKLKSLKIKPVNEYNANNYQTKRIWATAIDGTQIPISMIARKDIDFENVNEPLPLHLIAYGSYGYPYDVYFSAARLSMVDRGIIVGYAHIRGGGEFGRKWKLDGKLDKKMNTFQDFIACSQHLIDCGLTSNQKLCISGGSAGGLLMGAVMNMRSDLYHAVIADVPFVDVLNSILDSSLPLTAGEWEEWGDPRTMNDYFTIKAYSPYDNISTQKYPNILLEAGLNDTRVKYWEPAKFCCKLREMKRNFGHLYDQNEEDNEILLKTTMDAGHGGASGRYGRIKEIAFEYAFLLDKLGILNIANPNLTLTVDEKDEQKWKECK